MKRNNIQLISIDGDGCLFAYTNIGSRYHSSWDALGFAFGLKESWDERTKKYFKKGVSDLHWAREDVADLAGRDVRTAEQVMHPVPYSLGARDFLETSRGKLIRGLLSTCVDITGKKAADETGLDFCHCNVLHQNNGNFSGTHDHLVPLWEKHLKIPEICDRYSLLPSQICHVGDGENDLSVAEKVGMFVAFNPKKEEVAKKADFIIYDFRKLNMILGLN